MKNVLNALVLLLFAITAGAQNGWNVLTTGTTLNLLDVQAYSSDTVFIAGDDGILLKSFNGGGTFVTQQDFSQPVYTAVHFRTADTGFVASGSGFVRISTNGGQNFTNSGNCTCYISDICFSNASTGLYSGLTGLYRSTNGGVSFGSTPLATTAPRKMEAPADSVFVGYKNGIVLKSTDYGQTFSPDTVHTASAYPFCGLHFFNPQQGYALTADGYLYYTGDQGSTWSFVYNSPLTNIQCMTFLDSLTGYLIEGPQRNHIYKTINGGQTWNLDYTSTSAMEAIDTKGNVVYISGQLGLALKNDSYTGISTSGETADAKLFPNPAADETILQLPNAVAGTTYVITDLSGRIVDRGTLTGLTTRIRTDALAAGIYMLRPGPESRTGLKLVKQ